MTDMWFVVDGNVEPDTPRTTISPEKNTAEQTGQQSRPKQKGSTMEDNMNAKRSEMYEAAINYMKQSSPVCFDRPLISPWAKWLKMADRYHSGGGRPPYIKLKLIMCRFQKYMMEML